MKSRVLRVFCDGTAERLDDGETVRDFGSAARVGPSCTQETAETLLGSASSERLEVFRLYHHLVCRALGKTEVFRLYHHSRVAARLI